MPEIIEVKHYADFIVSKIGNKQLTEINIVNGRYKKHGPFQNYDNLINLLPLQVLAVQTKGKLLYITLENNYYIIVTLGLSGGWVYEKNKKIHYSKNFTEYADYVDKKEMDQYSDSLLKHLNVEFKTGLGSLWFYDSLSFGTIRIINDSKQLDKILKGLGPDIMDNETDLKLFSERVGKKKDKEIGNVLLNQKVVSGIGNYLRADILYVAKISPFRKVNKLSDKDMETIYNACKLLTWGNYDLEYAKKMKYYNKNTKLPEDYNRLFFIYNAEEDMFGNQVVKKELFEGSQKRFVYYVPSIQM
jgi:formamidopyrimidine-DNA glycosylase